MGVIKKKKNKRKFKIKIGESQRKKERSFGQASVQILKEINYTDGNEEKYRETWVGILGELIQGLTTILP